MRTIITRDIDEAIGATARPERGDGQLPLGMDFDRAEWCGCSACGKR